MENTAHKEEAAKSPFGRLPPEIRAQIYRHLIRVRVLVLRHCIAGNNFGRAPPAVFLASKAFYSEAEDYLLENEGLVLGLEGASPNKTLSDQRRERAKDVAARLGGVRDLLLKTRHLRLIFRFDGPIVESVQSMGLLLDWLKKVLDLRTEPLQRLEVDFRGQRWWYARSVPGHREEDWLENANKGGAALPCDPLLTTVARIRCDVLHSEFNVIGKGAISDAACARLLEACKVARELDSPSGPHATAPQEQDALRKVINAYWRQASFMARLTNGENDNFLSVYRFGDRDDRRQYASATVTRMKQHVQALLSKPRKKGVYS